MEIVKSKKVDFAWIALTSIRIVAIFFLIASVVGLVWSSGIVELADRLFSTQQNVAEDLPHGIDAVAGVVFVYIGLMYIGVSLAVFILSVLAIIFTSISLRKKKAASTAQLAGTELVTPQSPEEEGAATINQVVADDATHENK